MREQPAPEQPSPEQPSPEQPSPEQPSPGGTDALEVAPLASGGITQLDRLPCGTAVDDLLEQVANGQPQPLDAHQRDCVHCQAALTELAAVWAPLQTATPVHVPELSSIVSDVMARVRAQAANVWYTLELGELGSLRIAARVVAQVARDAARRVPGVRVALGRSTASKLAAAAQAATLGHKHPNAAVGVLGRTAVVDLAVAVTYGEAVHQVAREVQRAVQQALQADIGLNSVAVNVTIDDVLAPSPHQLPA